MNIKTVRAVYFTGTGTTKKVVCRIAGSLAEALGCPCENFDFSLPQAREQQLSFGPDDLVVLGVPVYAGRVPNLLLPYVRDCIHGSSTPAVSVVLYGNRNFDDGLMELRNLTRDNGFHPVTAAAIGRRVKLVVPIGVEKRVDRPISELVRIANDSEGEGPRLAPIPGTTYTELDALVDLTGCAYPEIIASGGAMGAEGGVYFNVRDEEEIVERVRAIVKDLKDEPPMQL